MKLLKTILIFLFFFTLPAWSQTWSLDKVIRKALETSLSVQAIQNRIDSDEMMLLLELAPYDWTLGAGLNYPQNNWTEDSENTYWMSSTFLQKNFTFGTTLRLKYFNNYNTPMPSPSMPPTLQSFKPNNNSALYTQGVAFEFEQNILRNFFGRDNRLKLQSAKYRYQGVKLARKQEMKKLIMDAAQQFWSSYISYIQLTQARKRTKDYKELVRIARKKQRLGHSQPGEVPQMLSQYEQAIQTQQQTEAQFKNSKMELKTFLQTKTTNFVFKNHKPLPLPKKQNPSNIEDTQMMKMAKMDFLSITTQLESQKYFYLPYLKIKAQSSLEGNADDFKKSYDTLKDSSPHYFVGLELAYPIPTSGWNRGNQIKAKKKEQEVLYQKKKEEFQDQLQSSWNNIKSAHKSMLAASKIEKLQRKALLEIRKSYIQGRVPINVLLSAQDRTAQIELAKTQAQKGYSLSLLQFYALRDKLLSRYRP